MKRAGGGHVTTSPSPTYCPSHFHCAPLPKCIAQHRYVTPQLNMLGVTCSLDMPCNPAVLGREGVWSLMCPPPHPALTQQHGDTNTTTRR